MHLTSSQPTGTASENGETATCAIVLVCWNNRAYLESCLQSLYVPGMRHTTEVVVVDNGSTDGSQDLLRAKYPRVRIVQNHENLGLARACNQGIECTTAPFVLLLNNDTVVNPASLDALIDFMEARSESGAVGGTLLNEDGSFQAGYSHFSTLWEEFLVASRIGELIWPGFPSHLTAREATVVGWLSSACLLLRRAALAEVGLLDEEYFIYGDEADLQFRLARAGWKVYYLPQATTLHFGGRSLDRWRRRRMVYRGKMLFYRKNYGPVRECMLRGMVAVLSASKMMAWGVLWPVPRMKERARRELQSNVEVLRLCARLE